MCAEQLEDRRLLAAVAVGNNLDVVNGDTSSIANLIANDGGDGISLREAIAAANSTFVGDTITFDSSVFAGGSASLIRLSGSELAVTETLTIDGSTGTDIVITADSAGNDTLVSGTFITDVAASLAADSTSLDDNSRVFGFTTGPGGGDLTLRGLTITGGRSNSDGGGVSFLSSEGILRLEQSTISGNSSGGLGGGIRSRFGAVTSTGSTISGNSSGSFGGGIYASSGAVTLNSSTVIGNIATNDLNLFGRGAGIGTSTGAVTLNSSTVSGNSGNEYGGGIYTYTGEVRLTDSIVSGNSSGTIGGGIRTRRGAVTLNNSTVTGNSSGGVGGGIYTYTGEVRLTDSIVSGNSSGTRGGGINTGRGAVTLNNSTVTGNSSASAGGGIYARDATIRVQNSTITKNTTGGIGGGIGIADFLLRNTERLIIRNSIVALNIANGMAPDLLAPADPAIELKVDYSLIGDTTDSGVTAGTGTGNLLNVDPLLGPLTDNGGPTQTRGLLEGSPAINTGDPSFAGPPTFDQRGAGFGRVQGGRIDIGAFEVQTQAPLQGLVVSTTSDVVDGDFSVGQLSLREAIEIANDIAGADTITFDASVFTGGSASLIRLSGSELLVKEALTIDGSTGTDVLITGDSAGNDTRVGGTFITDVAASLASNAMSLDDNSRVVNFTAGVGDLTLRGLTITGGRTTDFRDSGGGVRFSSNVFLSTDLGVLRVEQSTVSGNGSDYGGGIYAYSGAVTLTGSNVSGNIATESGGGIYSRVGLVTLNGSKVTGNDSADDGGGIYAYFGAVTLTDSTVSGNTSAEYGGGLLARYGAVKLTGSTVSGNTTGNDGGGIVAFYGAVTLTVSTVSGNSSMNNGGGIYTSNSTVRIQNSTITNNSAGGVGGGIGLLADNYNDDERLIVRNSIVALNSDNGTAPDLLAPGDPVNDLTVDFSLIGDTTGSAVTASTGTGNLLNVDPLLGLPANNGGPTLTHALLEGSPAIDTGDPSFAGPPNFDQRGAGFVRVQGGRIDIGAFEVQTQAPPQGLVVSTTSDVVDGDFSVGQLSLREAIEIANDIAGVDTITFDASVFTGGAVSVIRLSGSELLVTEPLMIDGSTGTDVVVTADATGNDTLVSGTFITDIAASLAADATSLDDNSRVVNFTALSGVLTLNHLTITGGRTTGALDAGGGIYARFGAVTLNNSSVSGNSTRGVNASGGGVATIHGAVTLNSSTISGNSAVDFGGGISASLGAVTLKGSTVSGNSSSDPGGGIFSVYGAVTLNSSTVAGNSSGGDGGGLHVPNTTANPLLTLQNSIVAGNTAAGNGPDLLPDFGSPLDIDYSLIGDTTGSGVSTGTGTGNLLNVDPLLGPLADNGGPTQTRALLVGSPAINAGDPSFAGPPNFDQRGAGFTRVQGGRIDIGAFEVQTTAPPQGLVVSTTSDVVDGDFSVGQLSLREAIEIANDVAGADTITFDASVFTGGSASVIRLSGSELVITEALTIDGSTGTDVLITADSAGNDTLVSGTFITDVAASLAADSASLDDNSRVFNFTAGSGDLTLRGLTITGGRTNGVLYGGGISFGSGGILTLDQSIISGNSSGFGGGGLFTLSGSVTLTASTVRGNSSGVYGGGISNPYGSVMLTSSTVSNNSSGNDGGGIYTSSGAVSLTSSTVSGNSSGNDGGGIYTFSGAVSLTGSTVSGNSSSDDGGGIYTDDSTVRILNSTVASNTAGGVGGGISLFADDFNDDERLISRNSIVALNTDDGTAPDLLAPGDPANDLTVDFSLIGDTTGSGVTAGTGTGNLLNVDPLLGPLADNGGPTFTHALLAGSPAVNAGDPDFVGPPAFDQRGAGFTRVQGGRIDIGAFESQSALPPQGLVVSTTSDVLDGDFSVGQLSFREAIEIANDLAGMDTITFDASVFAGGSSSLIRLSGSELVVTDALTIDGSTGGDVVITADSTGNDTLVSGTFITDVAASLAADSTSLDDNSRVLNFTADSGDLTLLGLTITGGRTMGSLEGGGIRFDSGGVLTLDQSSVSGNSGGVGGGIYSNLGAVTLSSSSVSGNSGSYDGGGIYSRTGAVTLTSSSVSGNSSGGFGGGIYSNLGALTLINSTVSGNSSSGNGGGIHTDDSTVRIQHSTILNNTADGVGGGISLYANDFNDDERLIVRNSIVALNTDNGTAPDLLAPGDPANDLTVDFSLIGDTTGAAITASTGSGNLLNVDPLLGPLANNGGPTLTHALLDGSPAFDAGDPNFDPNLFGPPLVTDQRGVGFARVSGTRIDMGAVERQVPSCDFDGDSDCDNDDIDAMIMEIAAGTNQPLFDVTGDGAVDLADRDEWLALAGAANLISAQPYRLGDANLDGVVDGLDFILWNNNKFSTTGTWSQADWNADGTTDGLDFILWNNNKFMSSDSAAAAPTAPFALRDRTLAELFPDEDEDPEKITPLARMHRTAGAEAISD